MFALTWPTLLYLIMAATALDFSRSDTSSITFRYYGRPQEPFPGPLQDVCNSMVAVCRQIQVGECVLASSEMAVPYQALYVGGVHQDIGMFRQDELSSVAPGFEYMLLNGTEGTQWLWSHCSEGCEECSRGTGLVLTITPEYENSCRQGPDGDIFMIFRGQSYQECVTSLSFYYADIEERQARYRVIITATGSVLLILICTFCIVSMLTRPKPRAAVHGPKVVSKEEIEQHFPAGQVDNVPVCIICLAAIEGEELCRTLQCSHTFHAACIDEWWTHAPRVSVECPTCRMRQNLEADAANGEQECMHEDAVVVDVQAGVVELVRSDSPQTPARDDPTFAEPTIIGSTFASHPPEPPYCGDVEEGRDAEQIITISL